MIGEGLLLFTLERADYRQRRLAFTMRVVEHWHKFPREVVSAASLDTLRLDRTPSNLLQLMFLPTGGGLD